MASEQRSTSELFPVKRGAIPDSALAPSLTTDRVTQGGAPDSTLASALTTGAVGSSDEPLPATSTAADIAVTETGVTFSWRPTYRNEIQHNLQPY